MSRWNAYWNTCIRIINSYEGSIPLSAWLKDFFKQHKQMGSGDRKIVSQVIFCYYRMGHSADRLPTDERLLTGLFLANTSANELLAYFRPEWNSEIALPLAGKIQRLQEENIPWSADAIFPWHDELSDEIDKELFSLSHLQQPNLFLRIRPKKKEIVHQKLTEAGISFAHLGENCLVLVNATKIDQVLRIDEEVVIQDYNSQRAGEFFRVLSADQHLSVWDCCAGSGGKSIMAYDLNPTIRLTVSDSRVSILQNLGQRFERAGISNYGSLVADLSATKAIFPIEHFNHIIADVPCTGSGTWARTPEQLQFFDPGRIKYYSNLQKRIISQVVPRLNSEGRLIYITCSVFKQENEEMITFIKENFNLELEEMSVLKGYQMRADTMFAAVLKKS